MRRAQLPAVPGKGKAAPHAVSPGASPASEAPFSSPVPLLPRTSLLPLVRCCSLNATPLPLPSVSTCARLRRASTACSCQCFLSEWTAGKKNKSAGSRYGRRPAGVACCLLWLCLLAGPVPGAFECSRGIQSQACRGVGCLQPIRWHAACSLTHERLFAEVVRMPSRRCLTAGGYLFAVCRRARMCWQHGRSCGQQGRRPAARWHGCRSSRACKATRLVSPCLLQSLQV